MSSERSPLLQNINDGDDYVGNDERNESFDREEEPSIRGNDPTLPSAVSPNVSSISTTPGLDAPTTPERVMEEEGTLETAESTDPERVSEAEGMKVVKKDLWPDLEEEVPAVERKSLTRWVSPFLLTIVGIYTVTVSTMKGSSLFRPGGLLDSIVNPGLALVAAIKSFFTIQQNSDKLDDLLRDMHTVKSNQNMVYAKLVEVEKTMEEKFDNVDDNLVVVGGRLNSIEAKLDQLLARM